MADAGIAEPFVQDNHSCSSRNVLRGLHYQIKHPQGKLVRVVEGEIIDVAVDLRRRSPTFGRSEAVRISGENKRMLWIPAGFAHGFRVLSEKAHVLYKATEFYAPEDERTLAWNDADLKIDWELQGEPIVSAKDQRGVAFRDAETYN
jgi:dTDP-4-dehydrorhamnose 3,5-epimerase